QRAKELIRSTALLQLTLVEPPSFPDQQSALQAYGGTLPSNLQLLPGIGREFYVVRSVPVVAGRDLRNARPSLDEFNQPAVSFSLTRDAAARFGPFTEQHLGRQLAIVLDDRVMSAPVLEGRISDEGQIRGNFTSREAQDLSLMLRSGALPASLTYLEERTVGTSLGEESIRSGVSAAIGAFAFVMAFMLFFYRLAGLNAIAAVVVNLIILLGMMAYLGATMTLPGFAGFILTVGIGVDSNILIFERIKEELAEGKSARAAISAGFERVWWTIVDTHVASLIAAAFLFQFGTGPIRGFATTLAIGLLANVFTAVFVSRTMFDVFMARRHSAVMSI